MEKRALQAMPSMLPLATPTYNGPILATRHGPYVMGNRAYVQTNPKLMIFCCKVFF